MEKKFADGPIWDQLAQQYFDIKQLSRAQKCALNAYADRSDTLVIQPTGSGKSLCYALPAVKDSGLVLVISPLVALMDDQVLQLRSCNIPAAAIHSGMGTESVRNVWRDLSAGRIRLLMISPERMVRASFRSQIMDFDISLIAVDEAHCTSQWGLQFRKDYLKLGNVFEDFPNTPRMALTATATQRVQCDIIEHMQLRDPKVVRSAPYRENLKYFVIRCKTVEEQLAETTKLVLRSQGPGIVYVPSRRAANRVYEELVRNQKRTARYHGGMDLLSREKAQRAFAAGEIEVIVATSAFGMGINKRDVRYVYHCGLPGSLEAYYQESGRAGRDGKPAGCCLIYGPKDFFIQKLLIEGSLPEIEVLSRVYEFVKATLASGVVMEWEELTFQTEVRLREKRQIIEACLERLRYEGWLIEMSQTLPRRISLATHHWPDTSYWNRYADVRSELIEKLRSVRDYAKAESNERRQLVEKYFQ